MFNPAELDEPLFETPPEPAVERHLTVRFGYGMADFDDAAEQLRVVELEEDDYH
ncbi:hypothetical protein R8Z50_19560 [Longispora sp. K20-0274]|uniref:hypothetical protein n=1 Tax=Longispora sp. K20-0274 TaxID=3088255 RepID=UPI0039999E59